MAVTIDSGPIDATDRLRDVPQDKWRDLMLARQRFMAVRLDYDCRCLVQFVDDAKLMYQALGYASVEDMIHKGYDLQPGEIAIAVEWLRLNPPREAVPLDEAVRLGKRGRPKKGEKGAAAHLKRGSTSNAYWLKFFERDRTDLAEQVKAGEISAYKLARQEGYAKPPHTCPNCGHEF